MSSSFLFFLYSRPCYIRQANLLLNPERSVSHTHIPTWGTSTCVCVSVCVWLPEEPDWPCLVRLWMNGQKTEWDDWCRPEKLVSNTNVRACTHTTNTHWVSGLNWASRDKPAFPFFGQKKEKQKEGILLQQGDSFYLLTAPSLSPSLSCVVLFLSFSQSCFWPLWLLLKGRKKGQKQKLGREAWKWTKRPLKLAKRRPCV